MPGIQDAEHVKQQLGTPSHLELVHVVSPPSPSSAQTFATKEEAIASLNSGGNISANRRVLPYTERASLTGQDADPNVKPPQKWVVIEMPAIIDGSELRTATAAQSRAGGDVYGRGS
jgi:hypothetical protein